MVLSRTRGVAVCYTREVSKSFEPGRRRRMFVAVVVASALVTGGLALDAMTRRAAAARALDSRERAVRAVGLGDLALSSSARWIRHPTQVEPGAPFQDLPASFDVDPAGAVVGPPVDGTTAWGVGAARETAPRQRGESIDAREDGR